MDTDIKQIIPSKICLSCDGCCRYSRRESSWSPLFLQKEIEELTQRGILPAALFCGDRKPSRINLVPFKDAWACPCFDQSGSLCRIYDDRPLDCRVYPFLFVLHEGAPALAVDLNCYYVREHLSGKDMEEQALMLEPLFKKIACGSPEMFQKYPEGYRVLRLLSA